MAYIYVGIPSSAFPLFHVLLFVWFKGVRGRVEGGGRKSKPTITFARAKKTRSCMTMNSFRTVQSSLFLTCSLETRFPAKQRIRPVLNGSLGTQVSPQKIGRFSLVPCRTQARFHFMTTPFAYFRIKTTNLEQFS